MVASGGTKRRVLMLGWEFPPHISGGLGTACQGLTRGLAHAGVDVLFMVPRAYGDEDANWMSIVGANDVRERVEIANEPGPDEATDGGSGSEHVDDVRGAPSSGAARTTHRSDAFHGETHAAADDEGRVLPVPRIGRVREIAVDSPLVPYLDAGGYRTRLSELVSGPLVRATAKSGGAGLPFATLGESATDEGVGVPGEPEGWRDLAVRIGDAVNAGVRFDERTFELWGGYGAGLFDEVARFAAAAATVASRERFDVVHAHDWITYPAGVAAARARGVPLVCHLHATEYDRTGESPDTRVLAIERMGLTSADLVVCVSHYTAKIARRRYGVPPERIRVVHNAVTQKEQRAEWHSDRTIADPIVLFLGRITFQKGPDYFLEAAAKVVAERPRTRFVVSGSGDMLPEIVMRSARLGLSENLFFTGFLRGKDVERMYAMADLYVMPSVSEPFGITPLEAMALDVPVIVSRTSGVSEILANALKVDFWDTDELANKILATLEYGPLRAQLVENGREEVRRMRWELRGEVLRDTYEEILR
ncbi:MAG: glycosyltransferase [Planctomycetota bacterium]